MGIEETVIERESVQHTSIVFAHFHSPAKYRPAKYGRSGQGTNVIYRFLLKINFF